eukprot:GHVT01081738.1.p1 GENE.GHVT01081738.1~~GHVT01081738.1.p1  ORF type:complete len:161 (+),score=24.39 GHVT01081738.1:189-671(+)
MNPFADFNLWKKLEQNPQTREFLEDDKFRQTVEELRTNPQNLGKHMQDARIMSTLGVLLGVDLQMPEGMEQEDLDPAPQPPPSTNKKPEKKQPTNAMVTDEQEKALQEKEKGNEAYKKKDFEAALTHYGAAIELDGSNVSFRTNRAVVCRRMPPCWRTLC